MLRLVVFAFPAGVLWALLAPVAHDRLDLGPSGYGLLLGAAGAGSVAGAPALPRLRRRVQPTRDDPDPESRRDGRADQRVPERQLPVTDLDEP